MHPEIDRFAHLSSPIHRWDPRWKLATLFLGVFSLGADPIGLRSDLPPWRRLAPFVAALGLSAGVLLLSRIPPGYVARRLRGVVGFLSAVLVILPLAYPGEGLRLGPLGFSGEGFLRALEMVFRALSMVLLAVAAFGTAPFGITMKALSRLRCPRFLVAIVLFSYRYLFVYSDELRRMRSSQRARGFRPRCEPRTLRVLGNGLGVLLVGAVRRTQRIQDSMRARGFTGTFEWVGDFVTRPADVALSLAFLASAGALLAWRLA